MEFPPQILLIEDVCTVLGLRHVQLVGFEADDIIATLAKQASSAGLTTLILTGDRDSFQLIDDETASRWDNENNTAIEDIPESWLPNWMCENLDILCHIQVAHDKADDIQDFVFNMKNVATNYQLTFPDLSEMTK